MERDTWYILHKKYAPHVASDPSISPLNSDLPEDIRSIYNVHDLFTGKVREEEGGFFKELSDDMKLAWNRGWRDFYNSWGDYENMERLDEELRLNPEWMPHENRSTTGNVAGFIGGALGSSGVALPGMAIGAIGGSAVGGPAGTAIGFAAPFVNSFMIYYGNANDKYRAAGLSDDAAAFASLLEAGSMSAVESVLGTVPALNKLVSGRALTGKLASGVSNKLTQKLGEKGAVRFLSNLGKGLVQNGFEEGAEEGLQYLIETTGDTIADMFKGDKEFTDAFGENFSGSELLHNMAAGFVGGAALGTPMGTVDAMRHPYSQQEMRDAMRAAGRGYHAPDVSATGEAVETFAPPAPDAGMTSDTQSSAAPNPIYDRISAISEQRREQRQSQRVQAELQSVTRQINDLTDDELEAVAYNYGVPGSTLQEKRNNLENLLHRNKLEKLKVEALNKTKAKELEELRAEESNISDPGELNRLKAEEAQLAASMQKETFAPRWTNDMNAVPGNASPVNNAQPTPAPTPAPPPAPATSGTITADADSSTSENTFQTTPADTVIPENTNAVADLAPAPAPAPVSETLPEIFSPRPEVSGVDNMGSDELYQAASELGISDIAAKPDDVLRDEVTRAITAKNTALASSTGRDTSSLPPVSPVQTPDPVTPVDISAGNSTSTVTPDATTPANAYTETETPKVELPPDFTGNPADGSYEPANALAYTGDVSNGDFDTEQISNYPATPPPVFHYQPSEVLQKDQRAIKAYQEELPGQKIAVDSPAKSRGERAKQNRQTLSAIQKVARALGVSKFLPVTSTITNKKEATRFAGAHLPGAENKETGVRRNLVNMSEAETDADLFHSGMHEIVHSLVEKNPAAYNKLVDCIKSLENIDKKEINARLQNYAKQRGWQWSKLDSDRKAVIREEFICDTVADLMLTEKFWEILSQKDMTLAQKFLKALKDLLAKFKGDGAKYVSRTEKVFGDNLQDVITLAQKFVVEASGKKDLNALFRGKAQTQTNTQVNTQDTAQAASAETAQTTDTDTSTPKENLEVPPAEKSSSEPISTNPSSSVQAEQTTGEQAGEQVSDQGKKENRTSDRPERTYTPDLNSTRHDIIWANLEEGKYNTYGVEFEVDNQGKLYYKDGSFYSKGSWATDIMRALKAESEKRKSEKKKITKADLNKQAKAKREAKQGKAETAETEQTDDTAPAEWGERHDDLANSGSKGVAELRKRKSGWIPNAWVRDDIGGIALPYGKTDAEVKAENKGRKTGYGLAHIDDGHPDLDWDLADDAIRNGKITDKSGNRIILEHTSNDQKHRVIVQIDFDKISQNWLVTVYKKVAESPANPLTTAHGNKGVADNITPENSANNTIPPSAEKSSGDSEKIIDKITSAKAGSRERIMAFTELPDGEHTVNGKSFTKSGNAFTLNGKVLNARDIEKATRTTSEKMRKTVEEIVSDVEIGYTPKNEAAKSDVSDKSDKKETSVSSVPSVEKSAPGKIEDYGEKIGGARKDQYKQEVQSRLEDNLSDEEIYNLPASKVFPIPDYAKLAEQGVPKKSLALLKALREAFFPNKPTTRFKSKVARYVKEIKNLRSWAIAILKDADAWEKDIVAKNAEADKILKDIAKLEEEENKLRKDGFDYYSSEWREIIQKKSDLTTKRWEIQRQNEMRNEILTTGKALAKLDLDYSSFNSPYIVDSYTMSDGSVHYRAYEGRYYLPGYSDIDNTNFDAVIKLVADEIVRKQESKQKEKAAKGKLDPQKLYIKIAYNPLTDENSYAIYNVKDGFRLKDGFETREDAQKYASSEKGFAELSKLWDEISDIKERRTILSDRIGTNYRNGRNITPQELAETFGFRGVEFGKWAEQEHRQARLNETFDALMDLSELLGISPRAISLGGKLGIAFGARGRGHAMAHFESEKFVINLTKTMGAGSLAHEWLHALDNYFAKQTGHKLSMSTNMQFSSLKDGGMRDELAQAYRDLVVTLQMSDMMRRSRKHSKYWSRIWEVAARAFERYVVDEAAAQNTKNDFLSSVLTEKDMSELMQKTTPLALDKDMKTIAPAFDKFFATLQEKTDSAGNTVLFSLIGDRGAARMENAEILLDNLRIAREMTQKGEDAKTIKLATGWEKGKDGKWRIEIRDLEVKRIFNFDSEPYYHGFLKNVISASDLFKAYPELEGYFFELREIPDGAKAYFSEETKTIAFNRAYTDEVYERIKNGENRQALENALYKTLEESLIHEVQHAIQDIEEFAKGGNTGILAEQNSERIAELETRKKKIEQEIKNGDTSNEEELSEIEFELNQYDEETGGFDYYNRLAGEVEARNAVTRSKMSMAERRQSLLDETADVAEEDRIYIMEQSGVSGLAVDKDGNQLFNVQGKGQMTITDIINDKSISEETEILTDSGSNVWGTITEDMAKKGKDFGLDPLPIKLLKGNHGFGIVHIYKHLSDFPNQDLARLMELVFGDINKIYARDEAGNIKLEIFPPKARYYGILELRKQDGYYSVVSFFTRKSQHEKPKGKLIWVRSSQSATSQATNNQPKNEISGKMLQENQAELTAQTSDNINPLQAEVNPVSEKNPENSSGGVKFSKPWDLETEQYAVENKLPDVPDGIDLKSASQVRNYLREAFAGRKFRIDSDGRLVAIDFPGIRSGVEKRGKSRQSLFDMENIVKNSYPVGYEFVDLEHLEKYQDINGQFIYAALINVDGQSFVATIKLDDHYNEEYAKFKDIGIKEMASAVRGSNGRNNSANPPAQMPRYTIRELVDFVKQNFKENPRFTENILSDFSERLDQAYFSAVNRGDMETAQKMVENAAKRAGYTIKAYHGTNAEFYVFDPSKFGLFDNGSKFRIAGVDSNGKLIIHTIKDEGFFFSAQEAVANDHAEGAVELAGGSPRTIAAYLKAEKPLIIEMDKFYAEKKGYDTQDWYDKHTAEILDDFHKGDYDSIWIKNPVRPTKDNLYIVFQSEQIKSAEPIVYDDNGNIIPLSERFNPEKNDIRYSLPGDLDLGDTSLSPETPQSEVDKRIGSEVDSVTEPKLTAAEEQRQQSVIDANTNLVLETLKHIFGYKLLSIEKFRSPMYTDRNRQNDMTVLNTLLMAPIWLKRKYKGSVVESIVNAALLLGDEKRKIFEYLDSKTGKLLKDLRKKNKEMYDKLNKYLVESDRYQTGAGMVKQNKDKTKFTAFTADGKKIGVFDNAEAAWDALFQNEAREMFDSGRLDKRGADALLAFRRSLRKSLVFQQSATIRSLRQAGVLDDDSSSAIIGKEDFPVELQGEMPDEINILKLLEEMGDRSGYYFPRKRIGTFHLVATKDGSPTIRRGFINPASRAAAVKKYQRQGYTVRIERTGGNVDMIHKTDPMALSDILNQAFARAGEAMKEKVAFKEVKYTKKDGSVERHTVIESEVPFSSRMRSVISKMGGRYYDGAWRFANLTSDSRIKLEKIIKDELAQDYKVSSVLRKEVARQLVDMIRENGSSSSKIARRDAKGDDVVRGYIEDIEDAYNLHVGSVAGGIARNVMAKKMIAAWNGMDFDRNSFIKKHIPDGVEENTDAYSKAVIDATAEYYKRVHSRALDSSRQPTLVAYMDKYTKDMLMNPSDYELALGFLKGFAALRYLSSVRSAFGNLLGMIANVPAEIYHVTGADMPYILKNIFRGIGLYSKYRRWNKYGEGSTLDSFNNKIMDIIHKNGWDGADQTADAVGSAGKHAASKAYRKISDAMMILFAKAEETSRAASIYASFHALAKKRGINPALLNDAELFKLLMEAREISDLGNGVYNKANKLTWTRGGNIAATADSLMLFQTFSVNYLNMLADMFTSHDFKAISYLTAGAFIMGGIKSSLPLSIMLSLIGAAFNPDDEEDNDEYMYNLIRSTFGDTTANTVRYGLPSMLGLNFSGTFQDGIAAKWERGFTGDEAEIDLTDFPAFGVLKDMKQSIEFAAGGQGLKALEKLPIMPTFGANMIRSVREANEGVTDNAGRKKKDINDAYITPDNWATIVRFIGFNPVSISEKSDRVWNEKKVREKYSEQRKAIYQDYRSVVNGGKPTTEDLLDIAKRIEEYNAKVKRSKRNIPLIDESGLENALKDKDNKFFVDDLSEKEKKSRDKKAKKKLVIRNGRIVRE